MSEMSFVTTPAGGVLVVREVDLSPAVGDMALDPDTFVGVRLSTADAGKNLYRDAVSMGAGAEFCLCRKARRVAVPAVMPQDVVFLVPASDVVGTVKLT